MRVAFREMKARTSVLVYHKGENYEDYYAGYGHFIP